MPNTQPRELTVLRQLGFVAGVREDLLAGGSIPGLSLVEQFKSPSGAHAELSNVVRIFRTSVPPSARFTPFAVPRVPGALGLASAGQPSANVTFAKSSFCYLIGAAGPPPGTPATQTRALVIAAAQHLYRRVP